MRHSWARHVIHDFEHNPKVQFRFHIWAMLFWMINAVVALLVFFVWPGAWLKVSILYVLLISLYANWDTDFDAVSASLAAMHAEELLARGEKVVVEGNIVAIEIDPKDNKDQ